MFAAFMLIAIGVYKCEKLLNCAYYTTLIKIFLKLSRFF